MDINDLTIVLAHYGQTAALRPALLPDGAGHVALAASGLAALAAYPWRKWK